MTIPDVVLVGYYGRGNFGDDVLMAVAHGIARSILPGASIGIRLGSDLAYPSRLVQEKIQSVPFGTRDKHQLILHGGGGTFFDFTPHSLADRFVNSVLLSGGERVFVTAENALRYVTNKPRMSARRRIGLGLGVGTFTSGSSKLLDALSVLADFDYLWVRDPASKSNLEQLTVGPPAIVGSDLAFLLDGWCPPELKLKPRSQNRSRPRVGVILRDWPPGSGARFADGFRSVITTLSETHDITLISFDPLTDTGTLRAFQDLPQLLWDPSSADFSSFSKNLSDYDVLITSRAHGAICGACLGKPSIILEIEPKLAAVNAMLPRATRLAHPYSEAQTLALLIQEALSIPHDSIVEDVLHNHRLSQKALSVIVEGLDL